MKLRSSYTICGLHKRRFVGVHRRSQSCLILYWKWALIHAESTISRLSLFLVLMQSLWGIYWQKNLTSSKHVLYISIELSFVDKKLRNKILENFLQSRLDELQWVITLQPNFLDVSGHIRKHRCSLGLCTEVITSLSVFSSIAVSALPFCSRTVQLSHALNTVWTSAAVALDYVRRTRTVIERETLT